MTDQTTPVPSAPEYRLADGRTARMLGWDAAHCRQVSRYLLRAGLQRDPLSAPIHAGLLVLTSTEIDGRRVALPTVASLKAIERLLHSVAPEDLDELGRRFTTTIPPGAAVAGL